LTFASEGDKIKVQAKATKSFAKLLTVMCKLQQELQQIQIT